MGLFSDLFEKDGGEKAFEYDYKTVVGPWAMLDSSDGFPKSQNPSFEWYLKVAKVAVNILVNRVSWEEPGTETDETKAIFENFDYGDLDIDLDLDDIQTLSQKGPQILSAVWDGDVSKANVDELSQLLEKIETALKEKGLSKPKTPKSLIDQATDPEPKGRPKSLAYYDSLFKTIKLPPLAHNYNDDSAFAELRVSGFNPVVIQGVSDLPSARFPVTDAMLAKATRPGDTLAAAGKEGRLFLADFSALEKAEMGTFPVSPKYLFAPLALFALPPGQGTRRLVPVAIQCGNDPNEFPIHTPDEGDLWSRAKMCVQIADANYHELISHLGSTHLLMEPFVIETHNELKDSHPIGHLLIPHFEGTLFINDQAIHSLLGKEGSVAKILAPTIEDSAKVVVESLLQDDYFNAHILPERLKENRVMSSDLYYPYRDDALKIWEAINSWVTEYVGLFYKDDKAVQRDSALQSWAKRLVAHDGGRLPGFGERDANGRIVPGKLTTVDYLVQALTMVIFTASASHATFNFSQTHMTHAPSVSGAAYRAMPVSQRQASVMPAIDHLPPLEIAREQMEFLTFLAGVYHTQLGQYDLTWPQNPMVALAMKRFQKSLEDVTKVIEERNKTRNPPYPLLLPKNIPQSINV